MSGPEVPIENWAESIGFEPTYEDGHALEIKRAVEEASAIADARTEVQAIAVQPTERETVAEHNYFMGEAKDTSRHVRWIRDYAKSDFDLAA